LSMVPINKTRMKIKSPTKKLSKRLLRTYACNIFMDEILYFAYDNSSSNFFLLNIKKREIAWVHL
jgi:hypothetical protein